MTSGGDTKLPTLNNEGLSESSINKDGHSEPSINSVQRGSAALGSSASSSYTETSTATPNNRDASVEILPAAVHRPNDPEKAESQEDGATVDVEKQEDWTVHAGHELAEKRHGSVARNIRYRLMSVYRRLFSIVFLANLGMAIAIAVTKRCTVEWLAAACLGNLTATVVMRHDHMVNMLFRSFASVPRSWPLWIRRHCAKVYTFGGIHSGCAFFSVIWLIWLTGSLTHNYCHGVQIVTMPTVVLCWTVVLLLCLMTTSAYPTVRQHYHNYFEMTHRFAGWLSVALVWGLIVSLTKDTTHFAVGPSLGRALINSPSFWFLTIISLCLVYPWLHLRKLSVQTEVLSSHACRIYVKDRSYIRPYPGSFVRLSQSPLFEWHSFAAIAESGEDKGDYSVVVSKAGDWTSNVIAHPPTEMWYKGVPTCGVLHVSKLFRKIVLIATGSGIGPCLAVLRSGEVPCRVLWSTRSPRKTFGDGLVGDVLKADKDAVIYDTASGSRPDVVKMAYSMYRESKAEAVVIISNPSLTYKVVYGLESRGVPAFGAIWDS